MKFITYEIDSKISRISRIGLLAQLNQAEIIIDLNLSFASLLKEKGNEPRYLEYANFRIPHKMCDFIAGGEPSLETARETLDYIRTIGKTCQGPNGEQIIWPLEEVRICAPVPEPISFRDFLIHEGHKAAGAKRRNTTIDPIWYELPSCYKGNRLSIIGPEESIKWPYYTDKLDYELELGMFIGKKGKDIKENEAMDHVFGFTVLNDFSARDIQINEMKNWLGPHKGKDFGTAIGPCIVTKDEFDPKDAIMIARVNGEEWSRGNSGNAFYSWEKMIEYASMEEELIPGEMFGSGTVATGCGADLDKWIKPGDIIELEIEGIGILKNTIVKQNEG
tara:strand:+ start:8681 stop:9682 length:1002 start_codon:yes stop_codon:yes gene_type:complete